MMAKPKRLSRLATRLKSEGVAQSVGIDLERAKWSGEEKLLKAKYDDALARLQIAEARIETLVAFDESRTTPRWSAAKRAKSGSATAGILISDFHCEETVDPAEVNGKNEYNLDIAEASLQRVFQKALMLIEDARQLANIRSLVVWLGGDMISGHIHENLREDNVLTPLAACRWASERLEAGLRLLLSQSGMDDILVVTSHGNHGRDTIKMRVSGAADHSYEHDMYLDLRRRVESPKMRWQVGPGYHNYVDIQGQTVRFSHGHAIRYQGGIGGIHIPANKAIAAWNKSQCADIDMFGHWHTMLWNWHWISNGSIIGHSPWAVQIKADYQPPLQTFFVIDRGRGLTRVLPIFCR